MNIYRVRCFEDSIEFESFLVDGKSKEEAADKVVRVLIDNKITIPSSIELEVKKVKFDGNYYLPIEEEENEYIS